MWLLASGHNTGEETPKGVQASVPRGCCVGSRWCCPAVGTTVISKTNSLSLILSLLSKLLIPIDSVMTGFWIRKVRRMRRMITNCPVPSPKHLGKRLKSSYIGDWLHLITKYRPIFRIFLPACLLLNCIIKAQELSLCFREKKNVYALVPSSPNLSDISWLWAWRSDVSRGSCYLCTTVTRATSSPSPRLQPTSTPDHMSYSQEEEESEICKGT